MKTRTFLITTNQNFLKPKNPRAKIIFLGEWCNSYSQKDAYKFQVKKSVSYHWNNRKKLKQDYKIIQKHYKYLLKKLTIILNNIHKVKKQERYWNILIGPWLFRLLTIYFDRYIQIKKIIEKNPNLRAISIKSDPYKFTPNDTQEFVDLCIDDPFNESICAEILKELRVNIQYKRPSFKRESKKNKNTENRPFINLLQNISRWIPYILYKNNKIVTEAIYLKKRHEIFLNILLGQIPQKLNFGTIPALKANLTMRNKLKTACRFRGRFTHRFGNIIHKYFPKIFLEGFVCQKNKLDSSYLPLMPKVIFTCNSHWYNDSFKMWAAEKIQYGAKLVIGQHGGFYGLAEWGSQEEHELKIADAYISWGWKSRRHKIHPLGILTRQDENIRPNSNGGIVLIQNQIRRFPYLNRSSPICSEDWNPYFRDLVKFKNNLSLDICNNLTIRPFFCKPQNEDLQWKEEWPQVRFDNSKTRISKYITNYRVAVITYQGTPLNELMYMNFPHIIMWDPHFWELRPEAKSVFQMLKKAGLFFDNPQKAAEKINLIWGSVNEWWFSRQVQRARKIFCTRYAKKSLGICFDLKNLFLHEFK